MEIQGRIFRVLEPVNGVSKSGKEWSAQEFVIETGGQYPKKICFEVFGIDKIKDMNLHVGETVRVFFEIEAREWNGRWFNKLSAWKVEKFGDVYRQPAQPAQQVQQQPAVTNNYPPSSGSKDDLPY